MASTRAFKNLASLKQQFDQPFDEGRHDNAPEENGQVPARLTSTSHTLTSIPSPVLVRAHDPVHPVSTVTGKVDGRRLRKVLKSPSTSLSVAVRAELHEEVSQMLFARKSTWIALLDELLTKHVADAKAHGQFPK